MRHRQRGFPALPDAGRYPPTPWAAARLYRGFVLAAILSGLSGFGLGAALLLATVGPYTLTLSSVALIEVHGAVQLIGWCGLFTMGVATHVIPRFRGNSAIPFPWPQRATLFLVAGGLIARSIAQPWPAMPGRPSVLVGGGIAVSAGFVLFAVTAGIALSRGQQTKQRVEHWLWPGLIAALVTSALYLGLNVELAGRDATLADPRWNAAFHSAVVYGFLVPFVFGVSGRAVAGLFRLRPRHDPLDRLALLLLVAGLVLLLLAQMDAGEGAARGMAHLLIGAALLTFTIGLRVLEPGTTSLSGLQRYVTVAYGWLVVAAVLLMAGAFAGANGRFPGQPELHAVGAGFLTNLIIGFGSRALPLFEHRALRGVAGLSLAFWLIQYSVATRVIGAFVALPDVVIATAAPAGLLGFVLGVIPLLDLLLRGRAETPHSAGRFISPMGRSAGG